jgi:putative ABC transport system permease protein
MPGKSSAFMDRIRTLLSRFASLFGSRKLDDDLDEELRAHIAFAVDENLASGMSPREARTIALRSFGGVTQTKEAYRNQRGLPLLEVLTRDFHFAWRQLWKSPGFTLTCILIMAIGIGVNTAIFSMMDAIILRPLAVPDLDQVVTVAERQGNASQSGPGASEDKQVALANYLSWKQQSQSFENLAVRSYASLSLTGAGDAARVQAAYTSANFFDVMRAVPLLGRTFNEGESQPGHDDVAVLSYGFWKKHFAADPGILGKRVRLDERTYTILGVLPRTAQYPSTADIFLPLAPTQSQLQNRVNHDYLVIGRLKPDVTLSAARAELNLIAVRLARQFPASNTGWTVRADSLLHTINGDMTPMYFRLILVATAFVLLVVCANVANLQFVRSLARSPEIAVRIALGAGRGRLLGLLLTENIVLGLLGAAGGLIIARICLHFCVIAMPDSVARYVAGWSNISLNGRALALSIALALGAGLVSGILPAFKTLRIDLVEQLKVGSRTTSGSRQTNRLRSLFAIAQIALSVLLVISAALMCKGMWAMLHMADEYHPQQTLVFNTYLPPARYATNASAAAWYNTSLGKLRSLPGVEHAEITTLLPDGQDGWTDNVNIENRPLQPGKFQSAVRLTVSDGYFNALRIPFFSGEPFTAGASVDTQPTAVVSRKFVEKYFPGQDAIGHRIRMGAEADRLAPWVRIVGVCDDVSYLWIDRSTEPTVYLNAAQMPPSEATYMITTTSDPLTLAPSVRAALASIDPTVPLDEVQTYQQYLQNDLAGLSYVAAWLTVDASVGLLLAAMGIFGVMANIVAERTRDIGVRIALGASPRDMLRMILRRAAWLTGIGVTTGILLAAAMARLSANLIFGVRPDDPVVFVSISTAIIAISLLVSWGPARRAASIDPMRALRNE